jgi:hypothetical protein
MANHQARRRPISKQLKQKPKKQQRKRKNSERQKRKTGSLLAKRLLTVRDRSEKARFDGAMFDVLTDSDIPRSLDNVSVREPYELVNYLRPSTEGHYGRCSAAIPGEEFDSLCSLQWEGMETAFQIGMLEGFVFAGSSEKEVQRMERGLAYASSVRHWEVKEERR